MGGQPVEGAVLREPMAFLAALSAEKAKLKKTTPQEPTRAPTGAYPVIGMASIMAEKAHGTVVHLSACVQQNCGAQVCARR